MPIGVCTICKPRSLAWLETQIGGPIPYWNFFSSRATDPDSPDSGIPQAFLDDTFKDSGGNTHPHPLRHTLARNGMSRASSKTTPITEVKRAQPFEEPDGPIKRADYIKQYVPTYLDQIYHATVMSSAKYASLLLPLKRISLICFVIQLLTSWDKKFPCWTLH